MRRRALLLALAMGCVLPAAGAASLPGAWLRVQQELSSPEQEELADRFVALEEAAREVDARRLTPYAMALVEWARQHPGELGREALIQARKLDPRLASPSFLLSRWYAREGSYVRATGAYLAGCFQLLRNGETRRLTALVGFLWLVVSVGLTAIVLALVLTAAHLRQLSHDAVELGLVLFNRVNAIAFAVVVLALPVFAALGPLWLLAYVFALTWAYLDRLQLVAAVVCCVLLSLAGPALEIWQQAALRFPPVTARVASMLDQRQVEPSTLREFADLEVDLKDMARYQVLLGELLRLHGDAEAAGLAFQRAAVADPDDPLPLLFLGNQAMEDGDIARAIQQYAGVIRLDPVNAYAHGNLAFAYDQSYRFQEGDEARSRARDLAGQRFATLGVGGRNPRVRYPRLGREDVAALHDVIPPETRLAASLESYRPDLASMLLSPLSAVFWVSGLIGAGVLAARSRWRSKAVCCARCGKVFCSRCKSTTESVSYCSQCTSVFLKRDLVSIDQQTNKMAQIRRWETLVAVARRAVAALAPGALHVLGGRVWAGLGLGFLAWICVVGAAVVVPRFLPAIEPQASALPVQVLLLAGVAAVWARSVVPVWRWR